MDDILHPRSNHDRTHLRGKCNLLVHCGYRLISILCGASSRGLVLTFVFNVSNKADYVMMFALDVLPCREAALQALRAYPGGLQLGGGVSDKNAMDWLDAGASHVIVTSFVFREGQLDEDRLASLVRSLNESGHGVWDSGHPPQLQ